MLALVFAAVGLTLLLVAGIWAGIRASTISGYAHAEGTVVSYNFNGRSYSPVVVFRAPNGTLVRFASSVASRPPAYSIGESVSVLYPPGHPQDAVLDDFLQLWFVQTLLALIGTPFFILGCVFFIVVRVQKRRLAAAWPSLATPPADRP